MGNSTETTFQLLFTSHTRRVQKRCHATIAQRKDDRHGFSCSIHPRRTVPQFRRASAACEVTCRAVSRLSAPTLTAVTSKVPRRATLGPHPSAAGSRQSVLPDSDQPEMAPSPPSALRRGSGPITILARPAAGFSPGGCRAETRQTPLSYRRRDWRREVARAGHAENGNPPVG